MDTPEVPSSGTQSLLVLHQRPGCPSHGDTPFTASTNRILRSNLSKHNFAQRCCSLHEPENHAGGIQSVRLCKPKPTCTTSSKLVNPQWTFCQQTSGRLCHFWPHEVKKMPDLLNDHSRTKTENSLCQIVPPTPRCSRPIERTIANFTTAPNRHTTGLPSTRNGTLLGW